MPERIITDSRGQRWDVVQTRDSDAVTFRHQSGRELSGNVDGSIDAMSTDDLLNTLDRVRRDEGAVPARGSGDSISVARPFAKK